MVEFNESPGHPSELFIAVVVEEAEEAVVAVMADASLMVFLTESSVVSPMMAKGKEWRREGKYAFTGRIPWLDDQRVCWNSLLESQMW